MNVLSDGSNTSIQMKVLAFLKANHDLLREKPEEFLSKLKVGEGYDQFIALHMATQHDVEMQFQKAGVEIKYMREPSIMRIWLEDSEGLPFHSIIAAKRK